jgi:hypothetical protein
VPDAGAALGPSEWRDKVVAAKVRDQEHDDVGDPDEIPGIHYMTTEETLAFFDAEARRVLGISGAEFVRRWDAGEYRPVPDTREGRKLGHLVMLVSFARRALS